MFAQSAPAPPRNELTTMPMITDSLIGSVLALSGAFDAQSLVKLTHGGRIQLAAVLLETVLVGFFAVGRVKVDDVAVKIEAFEVVNADSEGGS